MSDFIRRNEEYMRPIVSADLCLKCGATAMAGSKVCRAHGSGGIVSATCPTCGSRAAPKCPDCGSERREVRWTECSSPYPPDRWHFHDAPEGETDLLCDCGHTPSSHNLGDGSCACGCKVKTYPEMFGPQPAEPDAVERARRMVHGLMVEAVEYYKHPDIDLWDEAVKALVSAERSDAAREAVKGMWDAFVGAGCEQGCMCCAKTYDAMNAARKEAAK